MASNMLVSTVALILVIIHVISVPGADGGCPANPPNPKAGCKCGNAGCNQSPCACNCAQYCSQFPCDCPPPTPCNCTQTPCNCTQDCPQTPCNCTQNCTQTPCNCTQDCPQTPCNCTVPPICPLANCSSFTCPQLYECSQKNNCPQSCANVSCPELTSCQRQNNCSSLDGCKCKFFDYRLESNGVTELPSDIINEAPLMALAGYKPAVCCPDAAEYNMNAYKDTSSQYDVRFCCVGKNQRCNPECDQYFRMTWIQEGVIFITDKPDGGICSFFMILIAMKRDPSCGIILLFYICPTSKGCFDGIFDNVKEDIMIAMTTMNRNTTQPETCKASGIELALGMTVHGFVPAQPITTFDCNPDRQCFMPYDGIYNKKCSDYKQCGRKYKGQSQDYNEDGNFVIYEATYDYNGNPQTVIGDQLCP